VAEIIEVAAKIFRRNSYYSHQLRSKSFNQVIQEYHRITNGQDTFSVPDSQADEELQILLAYLLPTVTSRHTAPGHIATEFQGQQYILAKSRAEFGKERRENTIKFAKENNIILKRLPKRDLIPLRLAYKVISISSTELSKDVINYRISAEPASLELSICLTYQNWI
jgi:hypothetical protein